MGHTVPHLEHFRIEYKILVFLAEGVHLFPSRTQKLSLLAPMILGPEPWESRSTPGSCILFDKYEKFPPEADQPLAESHFAPMILGPEPWESRSPPELWCLFLYNNANPQI